MKIIAVHGENTQKSYERLKKFIDSATQRGWEISYVDESDCAIIENLSATSLFSSERFFVLRDFRLLGKKEAMWIAKRKNDIPGNLIIYHEGELSKTFLNELPKDTKIEEYKLPALIWGFLDGIYPGNSKNSIKQFHKIIEKEPVEFIFSQISRHIRDLYWVKVDPKTAPFPSWRTTKLKGQASKFTEEKLIKFINDLSDIDVDAKTGGTDLASSLDLVILKTLE
ncbi:MAG TPA: hypothetical protein VJ227_04590 [Patescibacteria group bacterium]|nr:hypothetical protein [Patescibacteria group bacterium]